MISIIIPNYNHSSFLTQRIDSVLNQTYQDFEIIILDDCSTDYSKDIIESYRHHPKVSAIVYNEVNSGSPFIQWQKGFDLTHGDYIWIAESDDYCERTFLEKLIAILNVHNEVGLIYCDSNIVDYRKNIHLNFYKKHRNKTFQTTKWNTNYIIDGKQEIKENLFFECTINNMSATLFRKDLIKHMDWEILKSFKYCGDWYFLITLAYHTQITYISTALNYFRFASNNFKKGTRSALNYYKERSLIRYYWYKQVSPILSKQEKEKLWRQMGIEMKIQLNEAIKGNSSFRETIDVFKKYKKTDLILWRHQRKRALQSYLKRS